MRGDGQTRFQFSLLRFVVAEHQSEAGCPPVLSILSFEIRDPKMPARPLDVARLSILSFEIPLMSKMNCQSVNELTLSILSFEIPFFSKGG